MSDPLLYYADVQGAIENLVEVQNEITRDVATILERTFNKNAKPYMITDQQGAYPKWLNELSESRPEPSGIWEDSEPISFITQLQLGPKTAGFPGKLEQTLYTWIPYTQAMARSRPLLTTDARPNKIVGFLGQYLRLSKPRMPGPIIACEFIWTLEFYITNPERDW